ncbi:hypothetical protein ACJX0J_012508, partial [Zea mays]
MHVFARSNLLKALRSLKRYDGDKLWYLSLYLPNLSSLKQPFLQTLLSTSICFVILVDVHMEFMIQFYMLDHLEDMAEPKALNTICITLGSIHVQATADVMIEKGGDFSICGEEILKWLEEPGGKIIPSSDDDILLYPI